MKALLTSLLLFTSLGIAAKVEIPDACEGDLCLTNIVWKSGFLEHKLSAVLTTKRPIQSVSLPFDFSDQKSRGNTPLNFTNVSGTQPFYFTVRNVGFKWKESSISLTAKAIYSIEDLESDGVKYSFDSKGSRLGIIMRNQTDKDIILKYDLLTLTAGTLNFKLNGMGGKYTDFANPKADALIPSGTTHTDDLVPTQAVKYEGGWIEQWYAHSLLTEPDVRLMLPVEIDGKLQIEKLALAVQTNRVEVSTTVDQ